MNKVITEDESIIWASGHYLTENLPKEYVDWEEQKLDDYLICNAWEPFEHDEANFIWECITGLAYDFRETINNKLKEQDNETI